MESHRSKALAALVALSVIVTACSGSSTSPNGQPAAESTTSSDDQRAVGQPKFPAEPECGTYDGKGCAPESDRIDIDRPTFSNPTEITNPLFPISELESVVLLGVVDDLPFRSETTLLPYTETVVVDGEPVEVLLSQYTAYLDGRITEVAVDRYAQADDGAVWYLGEDVYDYEGGTISVSEGTWLAGRDGPAAMIMAAEPEVGQAFRPEDIPGIVFEEFTVTEVGKTVDGPFGPVEGAIVGEELHLDGSTSDKTFAPGLGEFYSAHEGDVEALSLAVPANREDTPEPVELAKVVTGVWGLVESARLEDWEGVDATLERIKGSWKTVAEDATPTLVADTLSTALATLTEAVATQEPGPVTAAGAAAEVATLEWIRDRITGTLSAEELQQVDDKLAQLRTAVNTGNLSGAADQAARLANTVRTLTLP